MNNIYKISRLALGLSLCAATGVASASIITIGDDATGGSAGDIAIGDSSQAVGGTYSRMFWNGSGWVTLTESASATSMGKNASSATGGVAIGDRAVAGQGGVAIGVKASTTGSGGVAIGDSSSAVGDLMQPSVAIGKGASAPAKNSVALGAGTVANQPKTVAVGERRIVGVNPGVDPTDAVNLQQVNQLISGGTGNPRIDVGADGDIAIGVGAATWRPYSQSCASDPQNCTRDIAIGVGAYADTGSISVGQNASAGREGLAIGHGATAGGLNGFGGLAVGHGAKSGSHGGVAIAGQINARGGTAIAGTVEGGDAVWSAMAIGGTADVNNSVSIGPGSHTRGRANSVAFGDSNSSSTRQLTGVAEGTLDTDAVNVKQLNDAISSIEVTPGQANPYFKADGLNDGSDDAQATHANSAAIGSNTTTTRENEVAVGGRLIGQVANGIRDTDAATVGQVAPFAGAFGGGSNFTGGVFTPPSYIFISGASYNDVGSALADLDGRVYALEQLPPGGPGTPGETGPEGPEGPQGPEGPRGDDGRSAYEVAVEDGFEGTETEWLESLQGADGRDGRDGVGGGKAVAGKNIEVEDNEGGSQTVSVADNIELSDQGSLKVGSTTVNADGVSIQGGPSMTRHGIDAGNQRITGVAPGRIEEGSMDAVNGGQLWELDDRWNDRFEQQDRRIDALGAQTAAMSMMASANLPIEIGEVQATLGVGFQGSEAALAIGWRARLSERTAVSAGLSTSSRGKVMGGVGVSIRLGGR